MFTIKLYLFLDFCNSGKQPFLFIPADSLSRRHRRDPRSHFEVASAEVDPLPEFLGRRRRPGDRPRGRVAADRAEAADRQEGEEEGEGGEGREESFKLTAGGQLINF